MTATTTQDPTVDEARQGEFIGRLFNAGIGAIELVTIDIGARLGLYEVLNERGPSTVDELADTAGIHPRYAREWLEQQAVAGVLEVDSPAAEADDRRYSLPAAYADVLLTPVSMSYLAPVAAFVPLIGKVYDALLDAYRTGGGVPYADYEVHDIQAGFNRAQFVNLLDRKSVV